MSTPFPSAKDIERRWWTVDADGQVLGRLATEVARLLMGKHKPSYTPFLDVGDHVVIINADKIVLTGNKLDAKKYYRYSGYPRWSQRDQRHADARGASRADRGIRGEGACCPRTPSGGRCTASCASTPATTIPHAAQQPEPYEAS